MDKLKVYLSGGFESKWHEDVVIKFADQFILFNPANNDLNDSSEYTAWDIFYVQNCDILFAYMEKTNPSGFGLTLEIGLARSLNKTIILVDEKSADDREFARRFSIVRKSSTIVFDNLEAGLSYLKKFNQ